MFSRRGPCLAGPLFVVLCAAVALGSGARAAPARLEPSSAEAHPAGAYTVEASASSLWLVAPSGERLLNLLPELRVAHAASADSPTRQSPPPLAPTRVSFSKLRVERAGEGKSPSVSAGDAWSIQALARFGSASYRLTWQHRAGASTLELGLRAEYAADVAVREESLRWQGSDGALLRQLDSAYRWQPVRGAAFAGPLGPRLARLARGGSTVTLLAGRGVQGLWAFSRPPALVVELDHEENHPFRPYLACADRARRRVPRGYLDALPQSAGARRELTLSLALGELTPALVSRFPRGYRAALVLTDHADQSSTAKLEALAFGATGAVGRGELGSRYPGLVNRGLSYTKSVFLKPARGYAPQLDDAGYRQLIDRLIQSGVELGVHSLSGARDLPAEVKTALERLRADYRPRTWIDHQPVTNCEAITNRGWDPRGEWYLLPLLAQAGVRYLWSAQDVAPPSGSLNLLAPDRRQDRGAPLLYAWARLPRGTRLDDELILFASSRLFLSWPQVLHRLRAPMLRRLEEERGLFIGHVYLDTWRRSGKLRARSLLLSEGGDRFRLRPEVDALFARLAARQQAGGLWVTGIESVADHLLAAMQVEMDYSRRSEIMVRSTSPVPLRGVTLLLPSGKTGVLVDGRPPDGERQRGAEREVWFDLRPGQTRRLEQRDRDGRSLSWSDAATIVLLRESGEP